MKNIIFASFALVSIACAPKKSAEAPKASASGDAEVQAFEGREHCMDSTSGACFIDLNKNGRVTFYATAEAQKALLTEPAVASRPITFTTVSAEEYQKTKVENGLPSLVYAGEKIKVVFDKSTEANARGGAGFANIFSKFKSSKKTCPTCGITGTSGGFRGLMTKIMAGVGVFGSLAGIIDFGINRSSNSRGGAKVSEADLNVEVIYGDETVESKLAE